MNRLKQKYYQQIVPQLQQELGLSNVLAVPRVTKVVVNMGIADFPQNPRSRMNVIDNVVAQFKVMKPQIEMVTDHRAGTLKFTGNPMDLALQDDGFFTVAGGSGPLYTRQGSFRLDAQGRLVNVSGMPVMGTSGEIRLTSPEPAINQNGNIYEGDKLVGQLQVVKFADADRLINLGNGLYSAGEGATPGHPGPVGVRQGYLEMPNVVLADEMIRMIETMRHFESSQRVLKSYDSMLDKSINVIGEF